MSDEIALCPDGHGPMVEHYGYLTRGWPAPRGRFWRCEVEVELRYDGHIWHRICGLERLEPDPKEAA